MNLIAYCDGGGDNNHKDNFYCSFKYGHNDQDFVVQRYYDLKVKTVNEAEYMALILLLENLVSIGTKERVSIFSDSLIVVNQMNGVFRINARNLQCLYARAKASFDQLDVEINWITRKVIVKELGH